MKGAKVTTSKGFRLNFAPHIGFPTPDMPLFGEIAGSKAADAQIAFAVAHGFRHVQDPFAPDRSEEEQIRIGIAAKASGVGLGCFVYAPMARLFQPVWSAVDVAARTALEADVDAAIAIGRRIGSRHIVVLTGTDPARTRAEQLCAMTANLARLGDRAAEAGMTLCIEGLDARLAPQMLLHHLTDAIDVVRGAGHPAVRLIFDTAHIQSMDGDILGNMDRAWDLIEIIQLADCPSRVEPGAGELNFTRIIDEIEHRGFNGLVELEHVWSVEGADAQKQYLEWLGRWSAA